MKKVILIMAGIGLTAYLCACGAASEKAKDGTVRQYKETSPDIISAEQAEKEPETEEMPTFAEPFQGEWKDVRADGGAWHIVIKNDRMQMAYYEDIRDEIEEGNYKEYKLIWENGVVKTKTYTDAARQYRLQINADGQIELSNNKNEFKNFYEKISNNTDIPNVIRREKPAMGMTEAEVLESTWGRPKKRNKMTGVNGNTEQWVYDEGYIYFTNGYVTAIEEKKGM